MSEQEVEAVLAAHRVNYHHRNIGGETAATLRYTSCDGCDWKGGHRDEGGWEAHVAAALAPILAAREARARAEGLEEAAALVTSLRAHVDLDPHSTCEDGCGWFNYAAEALRQRAEGYRDEVGA